MIRARVLVVEADDWLATPLARALAERDFDVDVAREAKGAYARVCDLRPECVVSGLDADVDGMWLCRRIRSEGGPIGKTPFLFVCQLPDTSVRVQGLKAGADVFLERPITNDEIVAQVDALVEMSRRCSSSLTRDSEPVSIGPAMRGDIAHFPIASMLMVMEMERRTGTLEIVSSTGRRAVVGISAGLFGTTDIDGTQLPALEVLREVLGWKTGRFAFRPRENPSSTPPATAKRASVGALVLEALRLEDERRAAGG